MAAVGKALSFGSQIAASATTYYTATNVAARIDKCTVSNTGAAARTFSIYLVPSAGAAGVTNQIIVTRSINIGETYTCPEIVGHWLNAGQFLAAIASTASELTLRVSGIEVT